MGTNLEVDEMQINGKNEEIKAQKKRKNKQKRNVEECEAEAEIAVELPKEEKKKKKKQKNKEKQEKIDAFSNGLVENSEFKKKKKHKGEEDEKVTGSVDNGSVLSNGKDVEKVGDDGVVVSGKDVDNIKYTSLKTFLESGLPEDVLTCCKTFDKPSPIQSHSWPFLLNKRDFIGIAKTGSGKTLAFGIPAIMHVLGEQKNRKSRKGNPLCLMLAPTRELAQQIADVLCDAGKPSGVRTVCVYGGTSKGPQIKSLKSGVEIVIGTPGRLRDLIEMGVCCLEDVSFVVLDEADRMLDMGFEPEVRHILSQTSSTRQMVMFSATWPPAVHQLAQEFMDPNPVKVVVGSEDLAANHDVMQIVEVLEDRARDERLITLLDKYHNSRRNRVLVFVLYKKEASRVEIMLQRRGWKVVSISGDKAQNARTQALSLFKDGSSPLLIATDVAARGLDIPDVEVVINYSFPLTTEDYVHRIGRTGRAGKKGVAHTFFTKENKALSGELINVLREAGQVVPTALLNFGTHVKKRSPSYMVHISKRSMQMLRKLQK
ncbi:hypothetical protein Leryth_010520 [Lithospermum erythrorhizon]|nr:hypothetical protein Leryth_010520 [Lithospermum erythrorhizon]